jgi:hypothetical protein
MSFRYAGDECAGRVLVVADCHERGEQTVEHRQESRSTWSPSDARSSAPVEAEAAAEQQDHDDDDE